MDKVKKFAERAEHLVSEVKGAEKLNPPFDMNKVMDGSYRHHPRYDLACEKLRCLGWEIYAHGGRDLMVDVSYGGSKTMLNCVDAKWHGIGVGSDIWMH